MATGGGKRVGFVWTVTVVGVLVAIAAAVALRPVLSAYIGWRREQRALRLVAPGILVGEPSPVGEVPEWIPKWFRPGLARYYRRRAAVYVECEDVTAEKLEVVSEFRDTRLLSLAHTDVRDATISHVTELPRLEELTLLGTRIGDDGVRRLTCVDSLRALDLGGTRVTDACVASLAAMRRLGRVCLDETRVTAAGVDELRRLRPDIEVTR